jgi:hypothetical protein
LVVAATVVLIWAFRWYFDPSITAADVDRIRPGMTLAQVVAILRSLPTKANDDSVPPNTAGMISYEIDESAIPPAPARPETLYRLEWERGSGMAIVFFDDAGHVYGKGYRQVGGMVQGLRVWWLRQFGTAPPF